MSRGDTVAIRLGSPPKQEIVDFPPSDPRASLVRLRGLPLDPASLRELDSLRQEIDPEIFYRDLLNFGRRLEQQDRLELAVEVYKEIVGANLGPHLRREGKASGGGALPLPAEGRTGPQGPEQGSPPQQAQAALDAIQGRGAAGPRAEFLLRRLTREASEPNALFAMGAAGAVFRMTRLVTLRGLLAAPAGVFTRGPLARGAAALAGFALEAPAFTLSAKVAGAGLGRPQVWEGETLRREIASSYLVLGGMKMAAGLTGATHRGITGAIGAGHVQPLRALLQQGTMFSGILLGHALEQHLGLKPAQDQTTTLIDSLALLLQFHVMGSLSRRAFGSRFDHWQRHLDLQAEIQNPLPGMATPSPRLAWALPLEPQIRARELNIFSQGDPSGKNSPPLIGGGHGSEPPPDQGLIGRDTVRWGAEQRRSAEEVRWVAQLAAKLRVEMWNALNLRIEGQVAATIARRRELLVRLLPIDGSLGNYAVELHPKGRLGPQSDPNEVRYLLNTADGSLRLQDFLPNAVWELRRQQSGLAPVQGFIPFYRSIHGFASSGLKADPFLDPLSSAAKEYLLMDPTRELRRIPQAPPEAAPAKPVPESPKPAPGPTLLVRYFPRIMAGARESVDRYLEEMMIKGEKERKRLHGLTQNILLALHQREVENPEIGALSNLQVWLRPSPQGQGRRTVEVLSPGEAFLKNQEEPYGPEDVLLLIGRNPGYLGLEVPTLEHQYLRHNKKNPRIPAGEDLEFQRDLGLGDHLRFRMPIHDLHLNPPDLASWRRWMEEHDQVEKPSSGS